MKKDKRIFQIIYSINGWEYGVLEVECFDLKIDENKYIVYADGVKINLGEEIEEVEEINWCNK